MTLPLDILRADGPPFALVHRAPQPGEVTLLTGTWTTVPRVADLPLPPVRAGVVRADLLALLPYRQLTERGYACVDDATPLRVLVIDAAHSVAVADALRLLPDDPLPLPNGAFDIDDEEYAGMVRRVLTDEIGRGTGSNFVLRRSWRGDAGPVSTRRALSVFGRLLRQERGAYWTFLIRIGDRTLVGATPEPHVGLAGAMATMTPISGTYRYPPEGPTVDGLLDFLGDAKEIDELSMVVDEELKMMAAVCDGGGRVSGPRLREMARLAHTEYGIAGRCTKDVRELLVATMFAPTVIGSPLRRASQVVARYERGGRGYYGGTLALVGRDGVQRTLDSAICLRTADIDDRGRVCVDVGATIVRGSDPAAEAAETTAKAAALLAAVTGSASSSAVAGRSVGLGDHPEVGAALAARTRGLSRFWFGRLDDARSGRDDALVGRRITIVDAEDAFTAMLAHLIRSLGARVDIRSHADIADLGPGRPRRGADLVVVGPGPGDPRDRSDRRIAALHELTGDLLARRVPFLAVCLGHQVLAAALGLRVRRRGVPTQGTQREIDFAGRTVKVGFYNTFCAVSQRDEISCPVTGDVVRVARDRHTGEVYGLAKPGVRSVQFHLESILTEDGPGLLRDLLVPLVVSDRDADLTSSG